MDNTLIFLSQQKLFWMLQINNKEIPFFAEEDEEIDNQLELLL